MQVSTQMTLAAFQNTINPSATSVPYVDLLK